MPDLTYSELGRVLGVHPATVSRSMTAARKRPEHRQKQPPEPVNPGHPRPRFREEEVVAWWPHRPRRGAPEADDQAEAMTRTQLAHRYGVDHATVREAIETGRRRQAAGDTRTPPPPEPADPESTRPRYSVAEMDLWWPRRLLPTTGEAETDGGAG